MQLIYTFVEWAASFCEFFSMVMLGCLLTDRKKIKKRFGIIVLMSTIIGIAFSLMANVKIISYFYTALLLGSSIATIRYVTRKRTEGIGGLLKEYLRISALALVGIAMVGCFDYISMYLVSNIMKVSMESLYAYFGIGRTMVIITSKTLLIITVGILYYSAEQITTLKKGEAILLILVSGLCIVGIYAFALYGKDIFSEFDNGISLFTIILLYAVLLLTLKKQSDNEKKYKNEMELVVENQRNEILKQSVANMERTFELWKTQIHDYKHVLLNLKYMADNKKYDEICEFIESENIKIGNNVVYYKTGNSTADVIIYSKGEVAKEYNITYIVNSTICGNVPLDDMELAVVLGNLLDNAIEAAKDTEQSFVEITMEVENKIFYIEIRNSANQLKLDSSSKDDKIHHGIGLKSVEKIIRNKRGQLHIVEENNEVTLQLEIPYAD